MEQHGEIRPDYRKTLEVLQEEWAGCTKCELGALREEKSGKMVFGEGATRGIMLIGEGPGKTEEKEGSPFVGESGVLLRKVLGKIEAPDIYITNAVACRSTGVVNLPSGLPRMVKDYTTGEMVPKRQDKPPSPTHIEACSPRLYEEIYLVDPVIIVGLGGTIAGKLIGKKISITAERGQLFEVEVPGVGDRPVYTQKRREWVRFIKGKTVAPIEQNQVRYLLIPTLHPAYVLRNIQNDAKDNPFSQLVSDLRLAVNIYNRYMTEVFGYAPKEAAEYVLSPEEEEPSHEEE